jgi:hypothetical protein
MRGEAEMSRKLRRSQVAERYGGVDPRTIDRWREDPELKFPKPMYVGITPMWDEADLEKWDRDRVRPGLAKIGSE